MTMFLLLDTFWATSKPTSLGASQHPDKWVCQFGSLILAMSQSSDALLDHIADYLRFIPNAKSIWLLLNTSYSHERTQKTTRLSHLLSRRPLVTSLYQLVVALPLVVISLCCPLVILSRKLVVALPLTVLSLHHPLVLLLCQLFVISLLLVLLLRRPLVLSSCRLVVVSPLDAPPSRCLTVSPSRRLVASLSCRLVVSSSCRLVVLLSRRLVISSSRCAALSLYCHASWLSHHLSLPLIVPPSCPLIMPAGFCVASPCALFVLSLCQPSFASPSPCRSPSPTLSNTVKC